MLLQDQLVKINSKEMSLCYLLLCRRFLYFIYSKYNVGTICLVILTFIIIQIGVNVGEINF